MIELRLKILSERAKTPERAHPTDSGLDLFIESIGPNRDPSFTLPVGRRCKVNTGIAVAIDVIPAYKPFIEALRMSFEIQLRPRSGNAINRGLTLLNSPATIDFHFRGELQIILINLGNQPQVLVAGDNIAQMVVCPVFLVNPITVSVLNETDRGIKCLGSTDKQ